MQRGDDDEVVSARRPAGSRLSGGGSHVCCVLCPEQFSYCFRRLISGSRNPRRSSGFSCCPSSLRRRLPALPSDCPASLCLACCPVSLGLPALPAVVTTPSAFRPPERRLAPGEPSKSPPPLLLWLLSRPPSTQSTLLAPPPQWNKTRHRPIPPPFFVPWSLTLHPNYFRPSIRCPSQHPNPPTIPPTTTTILPAPAAVFRTFAHLHDHDHIVATARATSACFFLPLCHRTTARRLRLLDRHWPPPPTRGIVASSATACRPDPEQQHYHSCGRRLGPPCHRRKSGL